MGRNRSREPVCARVVGDLVSEAVARLAARHPSHGAAVVDLVVYQAATELVSTIADAAELARQLDRRAHARLLAMAGHPVAITRTRPEPAIAR
jgi:hypothetical protein